MLRVISLCAPLHNINTVRGVRRISVLGRHIPGHIAIPSYAQSGVLSAKPQQVQLLTTEEEINCIKDACRIAKNVLDFVETIIKPGVTTGHIDDMVFQKIIEADAYPVPLNFHGFPKSVCTSVNEVLLHGVPSHKTVLRDGDIINVDVTVFHREFYGDVSETFTVGKVDIESQRLIVTAREAVNEAIKVCKAGAKMHMIGNAIENVVTREGFRVCDHYCGHGIGRELHLLPLVLHYRNNLPDEMREGMCFTIEPAVMSGGGGIRRLEDGWSVVSMDGKRSAQHERAVLITQDGCIVLT